MRLYITPHLLLSSLLACFGLLLVFHLLTLVLRFRFGFDINNLDGFVRDFVRMFDLGSERNIPTLYTVLLFVLASLQCFLAAMAEYRGSGKWVFLGFIFIGLSVDEFVSIHEQLITPVRACFVYIRIFLLRVDNSVLCINFDSFLNLVPLATKSAKGIARWHVGFRIDISVWSISDGRNRWLVLQWST